jgi:sirohydrochlorin cobaltochelatase
VNLTKTKNVIVVPFFISDGLHSYEDIPALLGIDDKSEGPHQLHGRSLFYSTAIGTDSRFADVIVEQVTAFDQRKQVFQSAS